MVSATSGGSSHARQKRRRGKARPETHAREATVRILDHLWLSPAPEIAMRVLKRFKMRRRVPPMRKLDEDEAFASSGDVDSDNLLYTYIGKVGA